MHFNLLNKHKEKLQRFKNIRPNKAISIVFIVEIARNR